MSINFTFRVDIRGIMELFHQRIENTTKLIKSFKADQERLILNSTRNDSTTKYKLARARVNSRASFSEGSITNLLNMDCVVMPYCQEATSYKKLWPQALIVNRSKNCAEVGQIESHGSLWKIVPCNDAAPGSRVMLQTSERGELPRYLGPDLDIVELKVDAAVWNVKAQSAIDTADQDVDGTSRGLIVQFELIDTTAANTSTNTNNTHQTTQLLVCETSKELHSYSELFIDDVSIDNNTNNGSDTVQGVQSVGQNEVEEGVHPTYRSWQWEVFAEAHMAAELDFLEGFIH